MNDDNAVGGSPNGNDDQQQMMMQQQDQVSPDQDQMMDDNQQDYDEMDLTPYEDDDDATLHKKYCAAKLARKRAEEDLKLLCNRIGLLKMEEGKVSKNFKYANL